ncbi:MAG: peptidoglycan DD-metalloendopeptidase family protein, partial [Thermodesulfobacteriota bacterium]|nr:peptidoglycan DD-metalloendopeptidase family protein [Thermodesulfobacteriota bacterium]
IFLKKICIFAAVGIILMLHSNVVLGDQEQEVGVVAASRLNVRSEPGTDNPPVKTLKKGTRVYILKHGDKWLKILHEGKVGYVRNRKRYINIIKVKGINKGHALDSKIIHIAKKAEDIGYKIERQKTRVLTFDKKEIAVINSFNETDLALNNARKHILALRPELAALEKRIKETLNTYNDLSVRIKITEEYASKRLVALYKLNSLGSMHILASAESINDLFHRKGSIEKILTYDETIWEKLVKNKSELRKLLDNMNAQKTEKLCLETDLKKQIDIKSRENAKRSKLIEDIRSKKSLALAAIESLRRTATDLDQTIKSLGSEYNRTKQAKDIPPKTFTTLKGLLNMPVKGKIITSFGPYVNKKCNVANFRSGVDIKADRGEPIYSVFDGKILFSNWFKGYGNMIIVDHGNNYYTVYAHAEELFKVKGDHVEAGEVIATVGDTGSMIGPALYFEVRYHGKPVNPLDWLRS